MDRIGKAVGWTAGVIAVIAVGYLVYCVIAIVVVGPNAVIGGVGRGFGHVIGAFD